MRIPVRDHDPHGRAGAENRHNPRPQHGDQRRVPGEHAEIALAARNVDLIDLA